MAPKIIPAWPSHSTHQLRYLLLSPNGNWRRLCHALRSDLGCHVGLQGASWHRERSHTAAGVYEGPRC